MTELEKAIRLIQSHCENTECEDCEVAHLCIIVMGDSFVNDEIGVMQ